MVLCGMRTRVPADPLFMWEALRGCRCAFPGRVVLKRSIGCRDVRSRTSAVRLPGMGRIRADGNSEQGPWSAHAPCARQHKEA